MNDHALFVAGVAGFLLIIVVVMTMLKEPDDRP
jgi:hypothetical protein